MNREWLDSLKKGDTVIRCTGYYGKHVSIVARTTATQIITEGDTRYWKKNGEEVGGSKEWLNAYIVEPTPELLAEIRKKTLCNNLRQIVWEKISLEVLEELFAKAKNGQHLKDEQPSS